MKHAIIAACGAFTVAGTLTLAAQTPPQPQTPQPSRSTPSRTDERTTTLTGCLKAWDSTMSGPAAGATTPGASTGTSAAPGGKFVLTNVKHDTATTTAATGSPSKPDTTATTGAANGETKQYVLTAGSGVNLAAHNNHQVRVTGKVTAMADHSAMDAKPGAATRPGETRSGEMTKPGSTPDPSRPSTDRDNMGKAWPSMTVSSVTMISATCTNPTN
jgi:hypothetical protein